MYGVVSNVSASAHRDISYNPVDAMNATARQPIEGEPHYGWVTTVGYATYTMDTNLTTNGSMTNETQYKYYPLVKQPVYMVVLLSVMFGIIFMCSVLGNLSVLCVVVRDRRFHSATYYLIANLAVADLIVALMCQPLNLLINIFSGWRFGAFLCKAAPYMQGVSVCASVNTLVVIAVDRYIAICHVMRQRNTKRMAKIILLVIWVLAFLLMTPWALFYKIVQYETPLQVIDVCVESFPQEGQEAAFFVAVIFLVCYILPLTFIVACYFMIGYRVWHRDAPGITSSRGVIEKSKVRVIKMLVVVVLLFMISWMPLYLLRLNDLFNKPKEGSFASKVIYEFATPFAQWLGTSNSCMNPLVYCLFSQKIRGRIRAMLCCAKPEARSVYSSRSMCNSALHHSTSTRESMLKDICTNGHSSYGHHYGGGNLYHHRSSRADTEFIRLQRNNNVRSTHV